jgi:hypothetical protein
LNDEPVLELDDTRCADPQLAGAKASWLARGRHHGLSVLPGLVLTADVSMPAMKLGAETLASRGSGGARLEVGRFPVSSTLLAQVTESASRLGPALAVRSSSVLEGDGEWSGAFASYVDVAPSELEKAIAGCWSSAFTVATLERFEAVGLKPGSAPMAVLIQPLLQPEFGGVARLDETGDVEVIGIKGSPAPLVQGWETGVRAVVGPGGEISAAADAIADLGRDLIDEVARQLRAADRSTGANTCEWGWSDGRLSLLQLGRRTVSSRRPRGSTSWKAKAIDSRLIDLSRLARRYPGPLGESFVLAWAAADPAAVIEISTRRTTGRSDDPEDPVTALHLAKREAALLTAATWQMPEPMAAARAASVLRQARGNNPEPALDCLAGLGSPDPERAARVLRLLAIALRADNRSGARRIGIDRWEPFQAAVVESVGTEHQGVPASPGMGCGRLCFIAGPSEVDGFRPRDVIVTTNPVPNLAPLLWDAAGLVTTSGSPAAHLFESARSLKVPAVCSLEVSNSLEFDLALATGRFAVAVDGTRGLVFTSEW